MGIYQLLQQQAEIIRKEGGLEAVTESTTSQFSSRFPATTATGALNQTKITVDDPILNEVLLLGISH